MTLHRALPLPVQHGKQANFTHVSSRALATLRKLFTSVHTILIDEISMVSSFVYIHRRLCSIFDNDFGDLNVILVGDLLQLQPVKGCHVFTEKSPWCLFRPFFSQQI